MLQYKKIEIYTSEQARWEGPVVYAMSTSYTFVVLVVLLGGSLILFRVATRARKVARGPVWAGGVRHLLPKMTYTATGFSNPVRVIFEAVFRPVIFDEMRETVAEHFLIAVKSQRQEVYILERTLFNPLARSGRWLAAKLGKIHSGSVNLYAAYILLSLAIVLIIQRLM